MGTHSLGNVEVGDEGDDATTAAAVAGEDVLGEDAKEEVSPAAWMGVVAGRFDIA